MEDDGRCRSRESDAARGHFIEHGSEAEKIGPRIQLFAAGLFGGHIRNRTHGHTRAGERFFGSYSLKRSNRGSGNFAVRGQLRQTKIHQLCLPAVGDENVGGLNVAMNDAFLVRGIEGVRDLNRDVQERIRRKGASRHALLDGFTLEQLDHEEKPSFVFLNVVNRADVGVV
ncbi:MAG TPA: hypothetical protein VK937_17490 [Candidatus Limnocylindria bacterium]|nr:hypothetical protein [Candidatus Limnocylindria bacterium]